MVEIEVSDRVVGVMRWLHNRLGNAMCIGGIQGEIERVTYWGRLEISLLGRLRDRYILGGMVVAGPKMR